MDKKRCWKQLIEAKQIINILEGKYNGWKNHPIIKLWKDYLPALKFYYNVFYEECKYYRNIKIKKLNWIYFLPEMVKMPHWITDEFINSHRSNLLRKNREYYSIFGWSVPGDLPYIWKI